MESDREGAIWCRISTEGQSELSLSSQEAAVRNLMAKAGIDVSPDRVLKVDWTSMDLMACPEFQKLRQWIKSGVIQAVGVLDRDRLQAQGLQRLIFLSECKEAGVQIIAAQGPAMIDGPEGQLIELALAIGKERSVIRAQQGAKDGLRARAVLKGLPPVPVKCFGYVWDETKTKLLASGDRGSAKLIFEMAIRGIPIRSICKNLYGRGIPSPTGRPAWSHSSVFNILRNPTYGGRYYALRTESVMPQRRTTESYGKSSQKVKPYEEGILLQNIVIEQPILTWDEWLSIQAKLKNNKLQSQRNARRDYLLRSLLHCETHGRNYQGHVSGSKFYYDCKGSQAIDKTMCARPNIHGRRLEESLKDLCRDVLLHPETIKRELESRTGMVKETEQVIERSLVNLDKKQRINASTETNLLLEKARGLASEHSYVNAMAILKTERKWIAEEKERLSENLKRLKEGQSVLSNLKDMQEQTVGKLNSASNEDWRMIFNALGIRILVKENGEPEVTLALPVAVAAIVSNEPRGLGDGWYAHRGRSGIGAQNFLYKAVLSQRFQSSA